MSDTVNRMKIEQVPLIAKPIGQFVKTIDLSHVQHMLKIDADKDAPRFERDNEPLQDNRAYRAVDGGVYYRPNLQVAPRAVAPESPEVVFLKDADGQVSLHFVLEGRSPPGMPKDARPFDVRVDEMKLCWGSGQEWTFDQPLLMSGDDEPGGTDFRIVVTSPIPPQSVGEMQRALSTDSAEARLQVKFSYGYWISREAVVGPAKPRKPVEFPLKVTSSKAMLDAVKGGLVPNLKNMVQKMPKDQDRGPTAVKPPVTKEHKPAPAFSSISAVLRDPGVVKLKDPGSLARIEEAHRERLGAPDFRTAEVLRELRFTFDPSRPANRPIYAAIRDGEALPAQWTDSPYGMICRSPFPNTIYRLPDALRLAYNRELGMPHVMPVLYRDDEGEPRVRVTLRAVPWHDPRKLVQLRDWLQALSEGVYAQPQVITGGYRDATLSLAGMFPESIQMMGSETVEISLGQGIDITLDVTTEFYRYLWEILTTLTGLTGEVAVTVETESAAEGGTAEVLTRRIRMSLGFRELADLPLDVRLEEGVLSPEQVFLRNQASAPIEVGGIYPRLLQVDSNSVVPLGAFAAGTSTAFPVEIPPDCEAVIDVKPGVDSEASLWNAVAVELADQRLLQSPEETLDRIHRVLPQGGLRWVIEAECPVFIEDTVPARFENLYMVEVQILRDGYSPQQVMLGRGDRARAQLSMDLTLRDLLGDEAERIHEYRYRVRNIYFDRKGSWSAERETAGQYLIVFPNPVDEDG